MFYYVYGAFTFTLIDFTFMVFTFTLIDFTFMVFLEIKAWPFRYFIDFSAVMLF